MSLAEVLSKGSSRRQLIVVAIGGALLCAVLIAIYFLWVRTPYQMLFADLRSVDAATIVASLDEKKIPYRVTERGGTILVPADRVEATRLEVMSAELPLKGVVGFELFNKTDMGLTEFAQKINYQRALQGELARTIMTLHEVDTARVHLSLAEPTIFREDRRLPKASVTIFTRQGQVLSPESVIGVQRLIAAAVPDLEAGAVVVLDDSGRVLSRSPVEPRDTNAREREAVEAFYVAQVTRRLREQLPNVPAEVAVTVSAASPEQLQTWTPESRDFGLMVEVSVSPAMLTSQEAGIRRNVFEGIGADPALGDRVVVQIGSGLEVASPAPAIKAHDPVERQAAVSPDEPRAWLPYLAGLVAVLAITIAFLVGRRGRRTTRLTSEQRALYVQRLRALLEGKDGDAAPHL